MPPLDERAAVRRLFDRVGLGARRTDVDDGVRRGFDAALDTLLAPAADDPGVSATPPPSFPALAQVSADDPRRPAVEAQRTDQQRTLILWWLDRMSRVEAPAPEKLAWFWHGHFATSEEKVREPALMLVQNQTLRAKGLGDFRGLARAMVVDPAMVIWLDNQTNRRGAPNENLGRELMELFTLGVGHYSETDVRESARALTGWTYSSTTRQVAFAPTTFDAGPKTILGSGGDYDAGGLVDLLVARPDSARFVASRLWARLVTTTAPPSPEALGRLTAAYGAGTDLTALLRALVAEPAFRDPASTLVKQPVEWLVGLTRAAGRPVGALSASDQKNLVNRLTMLGQVPFRPPSVGGWPAGAPWLAPSATVHRLSAARTVLAAAPLVDVPSGPNARLEWARATLGVDAWSTRTRDALAGLTAGDPRQLLAAASVSPEYVVSA